MDRPGVGLGMGRGEMRKARQASRRGKASKRGDATKRGKASRRGKAARRGKAIRRGRRGKHVFPFSARGCSSC